jgi:N-formylglutamate deformylase
MSEACEPGWLTVHRGSAPLLLSMPHTGTEIPPVIEQRLHSPWLSRKDTDWWVERLYATAASLGASVVRTALSRTVIDANRDPSGASLYPGQATTDLCPTSTFDGEALYLPGMAPAEEDIAARRAAYFQPYHAALDAELARVRALHGRVVLYDCHSIRSRIPRLFDGELPHFNIGTFNGASCDASLAQAVMSACAQSGLSHVLNGRFKGGYTTRHYGRPGEGIHALQMELACRGYMDEPAQVGTHNWPPAWSEARAASMRGTLERVLHACVSFADGRESQKR